MGLFDFFKGNKDKANDVQANSGSDIIIQSPLNGNKVSLSDISDAAFSSGALGQGLAIQPAEGKLYSPVNGTIVTLFPTGHAVGLKSDEGVEVLVHIGMDTVSLDGDGFTIHAQADQVVKQGDLLVEFDIDKIKEAGLESVTPVVITNTNDYSEVRDIASETIEVGQDIIQISK